jgi:hypothetical protein
MKNKVFILKNINKTMVNDGTADTEKLTDLFSIRG